MSDDEKLKENIEYIDVVKKYKNKILKYLIVCYSVLSILTVWNMYIFNVYLTVWLILGWIGGLYNLYRYIKPCNIRHITIVSKDICDTEEYRIIDTKDNKFFVKKESNFLAMDIGKSYYVIMQGKKIFHIFRDV